MTGKPEVSVVIASYNHGPFVEAAIRSVLAQENVLFEVLVADDGSRDNTAAVVRSICDPRLDFVAHPINRGACVVTNELISRASGEFIAVMNSDDIWLSTEKLEYQIGILKADPNLAATFGRVEFIDSDGDLIEKNDLPFGSVFDQPNRTQGEWIRRFFDEGNCLCHPSVLIRRSCYAALGALDNRLRQLPDFDLWIRLLKSNPIHVSDRSLVGFRILPGENASSQTKKNAIRTINEHFFIALDFFDHISPELMVSAFSDLLSNPLCPSSDHVQIEGALLLLRFETPGLGAPYRLAGLIKLHHLLTHPRQRRLLETEYSIDDRWFQERASEYSLLRPDFAIEEAVQAQRAENDVLTSQLADAVDKLQLVSGQLEAMKQKYTRIKLSPWAWIGELTKRFTR